MKNRRSYFAFWGLSYLSFVAVMGGCHKNALNGQSHKMSPATTNSDSQGLGPEPEGTFALIVTNKGSAELLKNFRTYKNLHYFIS